MAAGRWRTVISVLSKPDMVLGAEGYQGTYNPYGGMVEVNLAAEGMRVTLTIYVYI